MRRRDVLLGVAGIAVRALPVAAQQTQDDRDRTELQLGIDRESKDSARVGRAEEVQIRTVLQERLPILALKGCELELRSADDIRIVAPVAAVTQSQKRFLARPARLDLRELTDVHSNLNRKGKYLIEERLIQGVRSFRFRDRESNEVLTVAQVAGKSPLLASSADILPGSARAETEAGALVRLSFQPSARERLEKFNEKSGRVLAVLFDGELNSLLASIRPERSRGSDTPRPGIDYLELTAGFRSAEEAGYLALTLNSGALPCRLVVHSSRSYKV